MKLISIINNNNEKTSNTNSIDHTINDSWYEFNLSLADGGTSVNSNSHDDYGLNKMKATDMCMKSHYNDVIMGAIASQITSFTIVFQPFIQTHIKNKKIPRRWPLCGQITGDWWIPRTNGQ